MQLCVGQTLSLVDGQNRPVGRITVEQQDADLLCGRFHADAGFAAVEPLFRAFEEAVNSQALSLVDELDRTIASMGFQLQPAGGEPTVPISDVQIWSDGGVSCRLRDTPMALLNGPATAGKLAPRSA